LPLFILNEFVVMDINPFYCPSANFLTPMATVAAAFLSFLVPFSYNLVSSISQKHDSTVAAKLFGHVVPVYLLVFLLGMNILMAIIMRFFDREVDSHWWQYLACLTVFLFSVTTFFVCYTVIRLARFMSSWDSVIDETLDKHFNDAKRFFR
jgi:hypothetical protein